MPVELPLFFDCNEDQLLGVLHQPPTIALSDIGMLMVVGGPQYRVGSHRQFVLLARSLAAAGIPVFRFDYRGMGDSEGGQRDFENISSDIRAALDSFVANSAGVRRVVLWGLCDAATANTFYALSDSRVVGQIALNPWVRTEEGEAQAFLRHYYVRRICSTAFWRKVFALKFNAIDATRDFLRNLGQSRASDDAVELSRDIRPLPIRVRDAQLSFAGSSLLILSGQDLTAREYDMRVAESAEWKHWIASTNVTVRRLMNADHTFSCAEWRDQVADWCRDWVVRLSGEEPVASHYGDRSDGS